MPVVAPTPLNCTVYSPGGRVTTIALSAEFTGREEAYTLLMI
jgi:hypothetical protein